MRRTRQRRGWVAAFALLLASSCIYDSADRCGDDMRYDSARKACVCVENAIIVDGGCRACAPDEVAVNNKCVCPGGEMKDEDNVCVACPPAGCPALR